MCKHSNCSADGACDLQFQFAQPFVPREFSTYRWLFLTQHFLCSGVRLAEEERRLKMSNFEFQPFQVGHLRTIFVRLLLVYTGAAYISCSKCL